MELIAIGRKLNDVTSTKGLLPAEPIVPWLMIASDKEGNIYEATLKR